MLVDLRRDVVCEDIMGPEAVCDVHALLPSLELPTIQLLEAAELLELLVFFIEVIEVYIAQVVEPTHELAPGALPLDISCLSAGPPEASACPHVGTTVVARVRPGDVARTSCSRPGLDGSGLICKLEQVAALHAVPVTVGNVIQADAVGVVGGIAAVAEQEDILPVRGVAYRARMSLLRLLLHVLAQPLLEIKLGYLLLVFDIVLRNRSA